MVPHAPWLTERRAVAAPYVDNGHVVGGSKQATSWRLKAIKDELNESGFQYHE